ncbi:MAG: helix-turn-helix transcriptional regulator [Methanobacteriaceae archaeon]|nr:helix-turn-helix transcriptional regulator [Methanobacteriaceae archaeon]MDD4594496.1 helix-turn-helix transcriptional regulator [Methanobacteriaceae archaeon]
MKTRIRYIRQEKGINQQELANKVGVTRQTINALENSRYNPSLILAYKITKALNCEYIEDVFILENDNMNDEN